MRMLTKTFTAVVAVSLAMVTGTTLPASAAGGVIRDDDGTMEASIYYTSDYDWVSKTLYIPSGYLDGAQSATLSIYAKADSSCGTNPDAQRLAVNGTEILRFNPCGYWSTAAYSWATFSFNPGLLHTDGNSFQVWDSSDPVYGNTYFGIDTDHDYGHSLYSHSGMSTPAGELMWYLTVVAPPRPGMTVTPPSIDFGTVNRGSASLARTVTVTSTGGVPLDISGVTIGGTSGSQFPKSADTCTGAYLQPGLSCTFQVSFAPTYSEGGTWQGTATIASNAGSETVALTGTETAPAYSYSPWRIDYGTVGVGSTTPPVTVTVSSVGTSPLTVSTVVTGGNEAMDYVVSADNCTGATLAPGANCTFRVQFAPTGSSDRYDYVAVSTNNGVLYVTLTGNGDAVAPTSTFTTANTSVIPTGGSVSGGSTDDASHIAAVWVTYTPVTSLLNASTVGAALGNCYVYHCDWSAPVPLVPGVYLVNAKATDTFGRPETPGPTITIVVA